MPFPFALEPLQEPPVPSPTAHTPRCPRCAYDLSGSLPAEAREQGTCPECGLVFEWQNVVDPTRNVPRWFVESPFAIRVLAAPLTALRAAFTPWRFWRQVQMHFAMRPWRLAWFSAACLLVLHFAIGLIPILQSTYLQMTKVWGWTPGSGEFVGLLINPYWTSYDRPSWYIGGLSITFESRRTFDVSLALAATTLGLMPLTPLLLRQSLKRFKIRAAHIGRIWVYTLPILVFMAILHAFASDAADNLRWGSIPWNVTRHGVILDFPVHALERIGTIVPPRVACLLLDLVWIGAVWNWALARYLRLPHAAAVAAASATIAALVSLITFIIGAMLLGSSSVIECFTR